MRHESNNATQAQRNSTNEKSMRHNDTNSDELRSISFTRFEKPRFTQVPNQFFDEMIPKLKASEMRVMLVIMRQTLGWGNKEWDRISISQLVEKSGMSKASVCTALISLKKMGLIRKAQVGGKGNVQNFYALNIEEPDFVSENEHFSNNYTCPKIGPPLVQKLDTQKKDIKIYKKEGGNIGIYADAVEVVEKPLPPSSQNLRKEKQVPWPPNISNAEEKNLVDTMGAELYKKYKKNALDHLKKSVPYSKNHMISLAELIRKFWSEDVEEKKQRASKKTNTLADKERRAKAWFAKVTNANPHTEDAFGCYNTGVEINLSASVSDYVQFNDPNFYARIEERLRKIQEATKIPYVLPEREE